MKLIGAGFGRTGTLSLKQALEQLGLAPCYHMQEVVPRPMHLKEWQAIVDGKAPNWDRLLSRYQAGVDFPVSLYYQELMSAYPSAKVLLSVRDADRWYDSTLGTIYQMNTLPRWMDHLPVLGAFLRMTRHMIWDGLFEGRFEDRDFAKAVFKRHIETVIATVPTDRLLVFSVKEGWEPLCKFLGVPVPDTPFPHANDRAVIAARVRELRWFSRLFPAATAGAFGLLAWRLLRRSD